VNVQGIIRSQYHAVLAMLKQTIIRCPDDLWNAPQDHNKFWHVAYHAVFYTHLYLSTREEEFTPWEHHREDAQFMGPKPWPPHDLPKLGEPYLREDLIAYIDYCWQFVDTQVPALDLGGPSGFAWQSISKLEMQIYNIRHIQQHTGELMERLGSRAGIDVDWRGSIP
jgi:hypothetical protein